MTSTQPSLAGRPDKDDHTSLTTHTWAVHGGNRPDRTTGAIRTPIVMANSCRFPDDPTTLADDDPDLLVHTRESGANQLGLQDRLARLDHGEAAAVFGTGMAALHGTFFTVLNPGDHAIMSDVVYRPTFGLFSSLLTVDATFTPPPLIRPLDHGTDLFVHSLTKYISGHGDTMGGARHMIDRIKFDALHHAGGAIAPFNAWLILRGSITLPLQLRRHCENAMAVAAFLASDPLITHVSYAGLVDDAYHGVAAAQLTGGHGGIVSCAIAGFHEDRLHFVNDLRPITSAVSLGRDETLIAYEQYPADRAAMFAPAFAEHGLIRLAIGLESAEDIIGDLNTALTHAYGPAPVEEL